MRADQPRVPYARAFARSCGAGGGPVRLQFGGLQPVEGYREKVLSVVKEAFAPASVPQGRSPVSPDVEPTFIKRVGKGDPG